MANEFNSLETEDQQGLPEEQFAGPQGVDFSSLMQQAEEPAINIGQPSGDPEPGFQDLMNFFNRQYAKTDVYKNRGAYTPEITTFKDGQADKYFGKAYMPDFDNEDYYGSQESIFKTTGKGLARLGLYTGTKVGQGLGFVVGLASPSSWDGDLIANASDNAFAKMMDNLEDDVRNDWLPTYQEAADRDKGFFARAVSDADFWAEDFVDGVAFLASAWLPGLAGSKLSLGSRASKSLSFLRTGANTAEQAVEGASKIQKFLSGAKSFATGLDTNVAWAYATASESMFEGAEVKDKVYNSLQFEINPDTGVLYTEDEKKKIAGQAAHNTFLMNMMLLGFTNKFELRMLGSMFGLDDAGKGILKGVSGGALGEQMIINAPKTRWDKFIDSKKFAFLKGLGYGTMIEGGVEENGQLAISRINEKYGMKGKLVTGSDLFKVWDSSVDYNVGNVLSQYFKQSAEVLPFLNPDTPESRETAMNIGLGGLLGGGMAGWKALKEYDTDKAYTEDIVKRYNNALDLQLKYGNVYETEEYVAKDSAGNKILDANGNPVIRTRIKLDDKKQPILDKQKLAAGAAAVLGMNGLLNEADNTSNEYQAALLRDTAWANYVNAHIQAGREKEFLESLNKLDLNKSDDLIKLGFVADDKSAERLNRYKTLAKKIVDQNNLINKSVLTDNSAEDKLRKNYLLDITSRQAIYSNIADELSSELNQIRTTFKETAHKDVSDSLAAQLNDITQRIKSQEEYIKGLTEAGTLDLGRMILAKQYLKELQDQKQGLIDENELGVKDLKQSKDGFYKYKTKSLNKKEGINGIVSKKTKLRGELLNVIEQFGNEWSLFADTVNGKKNFMFYISEDAKQLEADVNNMQQAENQQPPAQNPPANPANNNQPQNPAAPAPSAAPNTQSTSAPAPASQTTDPELDKWYRTDYNRYVNYVKGQNDMNNTSVTPMSFDDWVSSRAGQSSKRAFEIKKQKEAAAQTAPAPGTATKSEAERAKDLHAELASGSRTVTDLTVEEQNIVNKYDKDGNINLKTLFNASDRGKTDAENTQSQPTPTTNTQTGTETSTADSKTENSSSDIEAKKADIERRRQDSLNSIVETYDKRTDLSIGKTTITKADGTKESISDLKDVVTTGDSFQRLKDKINAKYDAELAALEGSNKTDEVPDIAESDKTGSRTPVKDYDQNPEFVRNYRIKSGEQISEANKEFQVGLRQIAPADSLANRTDDVEVVETGNNGIRYERGEVNPNYYFPVATPEFTEGQQLVLRVKTTGYGSFVNELNKNRQYTQETLFNADGSVKENQYDNVPIEIYTVKPDGKEILIGHIHEPAWISYQINGKYPHIANREDVVSEVQRNREIRKSVIDAFNSNQKSTVNAIVADKSMGVLRDTNDKVAPISERVNPEIKKGVANNRHGYFAIVSNGSLTAARGVPAADAVITELFEPENIAKLEGIALLMLPTPVGTFFPTFIQIPNVNESQSNFILEAWQVFTGQKEDKMGIVNAVYEAQGLTLGKGDKPQFKILRNYIHHYITLLDSDRLSKTGQAADVTPGTARLNIDNSGKLQLQVMTQDNNWYDISAEKFSDLPANIVDIMSNLRTTVRYTDPIIKELVGINDTREGVFLTVTNNGLKTKKMTYNEYLMENAKTYVDKGVPSKNANKDWVYFANPVVKFELTGTSVPQTSETKSEKVKVDEVNTSTKNTASEALRRLRALKMDQQEAKKQKNNC